MALAAALTVAELADSHATLTGQIVHVRGWLGNCQPLGCTLHDRPVPVDGRPRSRRPENWLAARGILIGFAPPGLERRLRAARGAEVLLLVQVNDHCWPAPADTVIEICTDRASQVTPLDLTVIRATPARKD